MQEEPQQLKVPDSAELVQADSAHDIPEAGSNPIPVVTTKPTSLKKKKISKKQIIVLVAVVVTLLIGGTATYLLTKKGNSKANTSASNTPSDSSQNLSNTANPSEQFNKEVISVSMQSGSSYLTTPKKLENLKFFKDYSYFGTDCSGADCTPIATYAEADVSYYHIGTTKDGKRIIVAYAVSKNIDGGIQIIAVESAPNSYQILMQHDYRLRADSTSTDATVKANLTKLTNSNVSLDKTTTLAELSFPKEATVAGQKIKTNQKDPYFMPNGIKNIRGDYFGELKPEQTTTKVADFSGYTLYKTIYKTKSNYQIIELHTSLLTTFGATYTSNGELASTSDKLPITWSSGDLTAIIAYSGGAGCGSQGYVIALNVNKATLKQVGTSKAGQKVYQLPSDSGLVKELYETDYAKGEGLDAAYKNLSLQQFLDKHAYFVIENGFSEYVVFQRSDLFNRGGCGKPVVYLYPAQTTNVSVKVGADVVKSEPFYESNGWQNVLARPEGQLSYQGKQYDSLFWEGYGQGVYPDITEGTIVASANAATTIRTQLAAQGFNAKEVQDFMMFWQPKLPTTPYVRLTWFGTRQMNTLAPLSITPAPNTLIRTFLDFEGLNSTVNLKPQTFNHAHRNGFTVTEWGGLLREGIR